MPGKCIVCDESMLVFQLPLCLSKPVPFIYAAIIKLKFIAAKNVFERQPCENDLYCLHNNRNSPYRIMYITHYLIHFHKMHQLNDNPFPGKLKKNASHISIGQCHLTSPLRMQIEIDFWLKAHSRLNVCERHVSMCSLFFADEKKNVSVKLIGEKPESWQINDQSEYFHGIIYTPEPTVQFNSSFKWISHIKQIGSAQFARVFPYVFQALYWTTSFS